MKTTPLFSGILYIAFGILFVYFAIRNHQLEESWGFFTYILIILATMDIGGGIKMILMHYKLKTIEKQPKK